LTQQAEEALEQYLATHPKKWFLFRFFISTHLPYLCAEAYEDEFFL
jgi:hypothetical protein